MKSEERDLVEDGREYAERVKEKLARLIYEVDDMGHESNWYRACFTVESVTHVDGVNTDPEHLIHFVEDIHKRQEYWNSRGFDPMMSRERVLEQTLEKSIESRAYGLFLYWLSNNDELRPMVPFMKRTLQDDLVREEYLNQGHLN